MSDKLFGTEFRFQRLNAEVAQLFTPFRPHTIALSLSGGALFENDPPSQRLYEIGGDDAVRSVKQGDLLGRATAVGKVEYRWAAFQDLDQNIAYLAWLRGVKLVAFCDVGEIAFRF